ncbi:hypothetical protein PMI06_003332 [Burkholderia sp. BT03]|nr:hypothetical protein PMI06_003332 [Burkholderia sp. BT03]SKC58791.1 hypothetical protein SAMN06266956_1000 [Paraburkholderia hospita]
MTLWPYDLMALWPYGGVLFSIAAAIAVLVSGSRGPFAISREFDA